MYIYSPDLNNVYAASKLSIPRRSTHIPHSVYPQYPHVTGTTIPINTFQYATMQPPIVPLINPLGQTMGYPLSLAVPMARVSPPPPYHNHVFVQNPIPVVPQPPTSRKPEHCS